MTRNPAPRKKAAAGKNLKHVLIAAGEQILEKNGLTALSLRATARVAGVSHMAPYRHFDDKDALLAAIAERGFRSLTEAMNDAAGPDQKSEPASRPIAVAYVNFAYTHPGLYRLMFSAEIQDKNRFPSLAAAAEAAFMVCSDSTAERNGSSKILEKRGPTPRSIAAWALVHGLAYLVIDGKIPIPDNDPESVKRRIEPILASL